MAGDYGCEDLIELMATLRGHEGCPWDKEQTHETLRRYLIEEAYETIEAIDNGDHQHLMEELGDLLLQIVFHAQIASEAGEFTMSEVAEGIVTKLKRRHPHIFGEAQVSSAREVLINWDKIKREEKQRDRVLAGVPKSLPGLLYAFQMQSKAAKVGFDWENIDGALEKVVEEAGELSRARAGDGSAEEEVGDLLFAIVNIARHLEVEPELALRKTCEKFERRFRHIEDDAARAGRNLADMTLQEKDKLWDEAKEQE